MLWNYFSIYLIIIFCVYRASIHIHTFQYMYINKWNMSHIVNCKYAWPGLLSKRCFSILTLAYFSRVSHRFTLTMQLHYSLFLALSELFTQWQVVWETSFAFETAVAFGASSNGSGGGVAQWLLENSKWMPYYILACI